MEHHMSQPSGFERTTASRDSDAEQYTWTEESPTIKRTTHMMAVVWVVSMAGFIAWALYYMWIERIGPF
jgi:hypothetical protein